MDCDCCFSRYEQDSERTSRLQYDPTFAGVETESRSCTDIPCCLVFAAFIAGLFVTLFVALPNSDHRYLFVPTDHRGLLCGYDNSKIKPDLTNVSGIPNLAALPDLTDRPDLFWIRPGRRDYSRSLCVHHCPPNGHLTERLTDMANMPRNNYSGFHKGAYCGTVTDPETNETEQVNASIENYSTEEPNRFFCPYASEPLLHWCLPNRNAVLDVIEFGDDVQGTLANLLDNFSVGMEVVSWAGNAARDVYDVLWVIAACTAIALVLSLAWLFLLHLAAALLVWLTVLLSIAALGGLTYACWGQWHDKFTNAHDLEGYSFGFFSVELNRRVFKVFFIILVVLDVIFILTLPFALNGVFVGISVIKLASSMLRNIPSLFVLPLGIFGMMVVWWVAVVAIAVVLFGTGDPARELVQTIPDDPQSVVDRVRVEYNEVLKGMVAYDAIAFVWGTLFLVALSEMTVAGVVAAWFFTRPEHRTSRLWCTGLVTNTLWRSLRYHSGSLALGSAIAMCKIIGAVIEYIDQKTKNAQSEIAKFAIRCMKCTFLELLKLLDRETYIIIAMHGDSFFLATFMAFHLTLRNAVRVARLKEGVRVSDFPMFLGRVFVAGVVTVSGMFLFPVAKPDVQCVIVPTVIVFICAWLASAAFTDFFEMGIDAMFICFLEDEERNDGSAARPKYASEELQQNGHEESHRIDGVL
jgi:choline transporter-like protein 2/4/5